MSKYGEMLKDPRWQRRRLEILGDRHFTCQHCDSTEKTLHVHHMYYERGAKPWEYPDEALRVLCEDCHVLYEDRQLELARTVSRIDLWQVNYLIGIAKGQATVDGIGVHIPADNKEQLAGLADFYKITPEEALRFMGETGWVNPIALYDYAVMGKGRDGSDTQ